MACNFKHLKALMAYLKKSHQVIYQTYKKPKPKSQTQTSHLIYFFLGGIPTSFMAYASTFDLVNFKVPSSSSSRIKKQIKQQRFVTFSSLNGVVPRINGIKKLKVAYQGVPGAFSDIAAKQAFSDCIPLPCRAFLDAITAVEEDHEAVEDTAGAVELLLSNRMFDTAAIASSEAALLYGLDVLAHGVQDESWNVTRFLILSKDLRLRPKKSKFGSKTSMVVAHHTGTLTVLLKLLSAFSTRDINLTKLEVNPSRTNGPVLVLDPKEGGPMKEFPCILYVDFEGSMDDQNVKDALAEISEFPVFIRTLGSYSADPNIYGLQ
ncbi:hypothetical protein AQUCO_01300425v1 [Aquilegia coerulea]|uniref:arogenate dehydratase n=1 Tax=Aquilegia coerulea TaxID=218851 RepID=A0A2G5E1J7_AQUCA|nr:hypothetical protein AQUCO_01300425v1 [Aquilegia coerulea]